jgi:hypothetical protein
LVRFETARLALGRADCTPAVQIARRARLYRAIASFRTPVDPPAVSRTK